jgi:hypothetical protein
VELAEEQDIEKIQLQEVMEDLMELLQRHHHTFEFVIAKVVVVVLMQ